MFIPRRHLSFHLKSIPIAIPYLNSSTSPISRVHVWRARSSSTMATPTTICVTPDNTGLLGIAQSEDAAKTVTRLLQLDVGGHHAFFNDRGFHNHIVHHLLSLYGTGAGFQPLLKAYDGNSHYQRMLTPAGRATELPADRPGDWSEVQQYLAKPEYYPTFLGFFQTEMERLGCEEALKKHLFGNTDSSHDLRQRMFAGLLHPMIQFMYGIEWKQPLIMAAALAQGAIHRNRFQAFLDRSDQLASERPSTASMPPILDLFAAAGNNQDLRRHVRGADDNNTEELVTKGIDAAAEFAAQVRVREDELDEKTAEMIHASLVVASAAAARRDKEPRYDFFLIHHVNLTPVFLTINSQPWIPLNIKVRMLEWKIRLNILQWLAVGSPSLDFELVRSYKPKDPGFARGDLVHMSRFHTIEDDGHSVKLARSTYIASSLLSKYKDKPWLTIHGDEEWRRLTYMILEATETPDDEQRWVRGAGFDSAWKDIPNESHFS